MPPPGSMRFGCSWLLLLGLTACGRDLATPPAAPSQGLRAETDLLVRSHPAGPRPIGLWSPRDGRSWRGPGPWSIRVGSAGLTILELEVLPRGTRWAPIRVPWFSEPLPDELMLLPREEFGAEAAYPQALDLLNESAGAYDAGVVRRWSVETLRVARPRPVDGVDYLGTLAQAVADWNGLLSTERFRLVAWGEEAEIVCELSEETRLGYVRRLEEDPLGHPLRMQIHLSPRWGIGTELYVRRAWMHELGHVLGSWGHSRDPRHLMHGRFIAVDLPHPEELLVLDWLWQLPHGTHLGWYRRVAAPSELFGPSPREDPESTKLTPPRVPRAVETVGCHPGPP